MADVSRDAFAGWVGEAVERVADQRVVLRGEVDADLVGAAGFKVDAQQGGDVAVAFFDAVMGYGIFAVLTDGHFQAVARVATQRLVDGAAGGDVAITEGKVGAPHAALLQLAHEVGVGAQVAGDDKQAAGVFVEAVHDAATRQLCCFGEVVQQGVQQGAVRIARRRMDDQSGRFVDDDDVGVGMNDVERNILRRGDGFGIHGNLRADVITRIDVVFGAGGITVYLHKPGLDARLPAAA